MDPPGTSRKRWTAIGVIVVIVVLIVCVLAGLSAARRYDRFISGMWVGDPAFLKRANLADMQLFIAPQKDGCRQGYLIMTNEHGEFIANQAFELRTSQLGHWWGALRASLGSGVDSVRIKQVEFDFDETPPMPETGLKLAVSMVEGTLTLYDSQKVYAFLGKDSAASAAAIAAYDT